MGMMMAVGHLMPGGAERRKRNSDTIWNNWKVGFCCSVLIAVAILIVGLTARNALGTAAMVTGIAMIVLWCCNMMRWLKDVLKERLRADERRTQAAMQHAKDSNGEPRPSGPTADDPLEGNEATVPIPGVTSDVVVTTE